MRPSSLSGGHPQDRKRRTRLVAQEVERLRYRVHLDVRTRSYRRRRDLVEHHRHLPEHCPWGVDARERDAVALDVHGSGDKHQHAVVARRPLQSGRPPPAAQRGGRPSQ